MNSTIFLRKSRFFILFRDFKIPTVTNLSFRFTDVRNTISDYNNKANRNSSNLNSSGHVVQNTFI